MQKSKVFLTVLILAFSQVVFAVDETPEQAAIVPDEAQENILDKSIDEALQNEVQKEIVTPKVEDLTEMTPNANESVKKEVVADVEGNINSTIKKFAIAMGLVVLSSVIIFFILTFMNKLNGIHPDVAVSPQKTEKEENEPDNDDMDNALKIFFDKAK